MKGQRLFITLLTATATFIVVYWASVFLGLFPVEELVPGYKTWFMSFPAADLFIGISAVMALIFSRKNRRLSAFWATVTGSALIFLGLYALLYGINTGLLFKLTTDEVIEIFIKVYCLSAGSFFLVRSWRMITQA